jgi:hypothetical protein
MKVTFPLTVTTPGGTVNTPFGPSVQPDHSSTFTAEVDTADIAPLFPPAAQGAIAPAHLTATELRAQYTDAELLAAIESPKL